MRCAMNCVFRPSEMSALDVPTESRLRPFGPAARRYWASDGSRASRVAPIGRRSGLSGSPRRHPTFA